MKAPDKEVRELLRKVVAQGCAVERLGSGHYRISREGDFPTVTISGTRVTNSTRQKQRALLRRLLHVVCFLIAGCAATHTPDAGIDASAETDASELTDASIDALVDGAVDANVVDAEVEVDGGHDAGPIDCTDMSNVFSTEAACRALAEEGCSECPYTAEWIFIEAVWACALRVRADGCAVVYDCPCTGGGA